jgi:hypothetical protein
LNDKVVALPSDPSRQYFGQNEPHKRQQSAKSQSKNPYRLSDASGTLPAFLKEEALMGQESKLSQKKSNLMHRKQVMLVNQTKVLEPAVLAITDGTEGVAQKEPLPAVKAEKQLSPVRAKQADPKS